MAKAQAQADTLSKLVSEVIGSALTEPTVRAHVVTRLIPVLMAKITAEDLWSTLAGLFPDGHPSRLFYDWLQVHAGQVNDGCRKLGIESPANGPEFHQRLREAVGSRLLELRQRGA